MDPLIYTITSGANESLRAQQIHANNLANAETTGFRADLEASQTWSVPGQGYDANHMSKLDNTIISTKEGEMRETGNDLDVAITGPGYFAVTNQGNEVYTRAGNFSVNSENTLVLNGMPVQGDGGNIQIPPNSRVQIAEDGTIFIQQPGDTATQPADKLKLVNPQPADVTKNTAGFLVARNGQPLQANASVQVKHGYLEGSNVSAVEELVATMTINRNFEIQVRLLKTADDMADTGNRLVRS